MVAIERVRRLQESNSMSDVIDFYYDYSSPYGYLGSERIAALAERHSKRVCWRPILLGAIMKITGQSPLVDVPMKGRYAFHDFQRTSREHQIAYHHPSVFPFPAVAASRATLWLRDHEDPERRALTSELVHALYRACYREDRAIGEADTVVDIAAGLGLPREELEAALGSDEIKSRLRSEVDAAIEAGVFGSPTVRVGDELFWGHDRLEQVDRWLDRGGW